MALYVHSGARGGTGRASNAFSVSVGYQISVWLAGASEHENKIAKRDFADVPAYDVLVKVSCEIEHIPHVFDIRDIPTPNILVEVISETAFNSMPSGDVQDEICVCVCKC